MDIPNGIVPVGAIVSWKRQSLLTTTILTLHGKVYENNNGMLAIVGGFPISDPNEKWLLHETEIEEYWYYRDKYIKEKENKTMTLKDLKPGMRIVQRNGTIALIFPYGNGKLMRMFENGNVSGFDEYDENMLYNGKNSTSVADIMKVYDISKRPINFKIQFMELDDLLWERDEVEEMTIEEIEKALGKKIKIVKEHE